METRLRPATAADLPAVERLLIESGLIIAGMPEHIEHFVLADADGRVVASAGLERYGAHALLRSVAVAPEHRNRGIARRLIARILEDARQEQVREIYLFTSTAPEYFRRFGFASIEREDVAAPVHASREYGECRGSQAMVLHLTQGGMR